MHISSSRPVSLQHVTLPPAHVTVSVLQEHSSCADVPAFTSVLVTCS